MVPKHRCVLSFACCQKHSAVGCEGCTTQEETGVERWSGEMEGWEGVVSAAWRRSTPQHCSAIRLLKDLGKYCYVISLPVRIVGIVRANACL